MNGLTIPFDLEVYRKLLYSHTLVHHCRTSIGTISTEQWTPYPPRTTLYCPIQYLFLLSCLILIVDLGGLKTFFVILLGYGITDTYIVLLYSVVWFIFLWIGYALWSMKLHYIYSKAWYWIDYRVWSTIAEKEMIPTTYIGTGGPRLSGPQLPQSSEYRNL